MFAPVFARYGVNEAVFPISEGPNQFLEPQSVAWFGTDDIGRDIYSRLLYGIRTSIFIGVATGIIATVVGTAVGSIAGIRGGRLDDGMMRGTDVFLAFPFLVAIIVVREFIGGLSFLEPVDRRQDLGQVHHLPARSLRVDGGGTARAWAGAVAEGARVHRSGAGGRGLGTPHHRVAPHPELDGPDPGGSHDHDHRRHRRGVDARVLRVRPPAGSGWHVARQPRAAVTVRRDPGQLVAGGVPRAGRWCCSQSASTSSATDCATHSIPKMDSGK